MGSDLQEKHKGALFEILASAWLLKQGYEVFRNISQHGPFDITIWNPNTKEFTGVDVASSGGIKKIKSRGKVYKYRNGNSFDKVVKMKDLGGKLLFVDPVTHDVFWHPNFL